MVERIWLAAEEPSAANQILLRHSGPILSSWYFASIRYSTCFYQFSYFRCRKVQKIWHVLDMGSLFDLNVLRLFTPDAPLYMSHFSYSCKIKRQNGISRFISALCVNCKFTSESNSEIFQNYWLLNHLDVHLVQTTSETSKNKKSDHSDSFK